MHFQESMGRRNIVKYVYATVQYLRVSESSSATPRNKFQSSNAFPMLVSWIRMLLLHVARARDITTTTAHVVERLRPVSRGQITRGIGSVVTHHTSRGGSLLRLEVDGLVLAAFHALLLDARQLDAVTVSELIQSRQAKVRSANMLMTNHRPCPRHRRSLRSHRNLRILVPKGLPLAAHPRLQEQSLGPSLRRTPRRQCPCRTWCSTAVPRKLGPAKKSWRDPP